MSDLLFWSVDRRFGLRVSEQSVDGLRARCREVEDRETGGILVGYYTESLDCAVVTAVSRPPSDSSAGPTWFYRGTRGLAHWLDRLWKRERRYYLGEWHLHPRELPYPSGEDIAQMQTIALSARYNCPEPILLIVGDAALCPLDIRAYVFPRAGAWQVMEAEAPIQSGS